MDLANLSIRRAEAGEDLRLRYPGSDTPLLDDDGNPLVLKVVGRDSSTYRRKREELIEKRPSGELSIAYLEAEGLDLSVACVVGWSDNFVLDGQKLPFNANNVRRVFVNCPWMREQSDEFCAVRANFLPPCPKTLKAGSAEKTGESAETAEG